jgi:mRNA interferase MazF
MRRGDVVTVAVSGDYGKPRPAVIVQSDKLGPDHPSLIVCQMTSKMVPAWLFRLTIEPSTENGLRTPSQIMMDKPVTVRRDKVGAQIGRLSERDLDRLDATLAWIFGITG